VLDCFAFKYHRCRSLGLVLDDITQCLRTTWYNCGVLAMESDLDDVTTIKDDTLAHDTTQYNFRNSTMPCYSTSLPVVSIVLHL
jgi:hypothetical protein